MAGPLHGLKVIEMVGLGPCPLAGQLLADLGADVIVIDRKFEERDPTDIHRRGKRSVALNLKSPDALDVAVKIIADADILIEGFRPGVMERLGLGPDICATVNPRLIFARMTGWGQEGPLSQTAGHDINYLAISGLLHAIGRKGETPVPPLNLAADYAGGAMLLLLGVLSALFERSISGKGQVVDAAMVDGVPMLMGLIHTLVARGDWQEERESNWLDGGAPFYRVYETRDGKYISVGALEPQFFAELVGRAGLPALDPKAQNDKENWAAGIKQYEAVFKTRTRDEWVEIFEGSDACVAPVLTFCEAPYNAQNAARKNHIEVDGVIQAAPAPRFDRTPPGPPRPIRAIGANTEEVLSEIGLSPEEITALREHGNLT